jgi:hypothetical protein
MNTKRQAPFKHSDGSGCWTKECSRGNSNLEAHLNAKPMSAPPTVLMSLSHVAQNHVPRHMDEQHAGYYEATDKKHFGDKTQPGSKFLDPSLEKVEHVLMLRMRQTDTRELQGDDREALIARGSDPNGFGGGKRYLMVLTEGTVGIKDSTGLPADTKIEVVRTKPGAPCSLVMQVDEQPTTDYAVIVLGKHKQTGNDFVITTFPGPVTKPTSNEELDAREGQTMTVGEVKEIMGGDFWINTKMK